MQTQRLKDCEENFKKINFFKKTLDKNLSCDIMLKMRRSINMDRGMPEWTKG